MQELFKGPKFFSSEEVEARAILLALMKTKESEFPRACGLPDAKELVQAIDGVY